MIERMYRLLMVFMVSLMLSSCVTSPTPAETDIPEIRPGILKGYLSSDEYPDSLALLPPPPAAGSAAEAFDDAVSASSLKLYDTPRWRLAIEDNSLKFPEAAGTFSCALNAPITETDTPSLYRLLRRSLTDAGLSTYAAKDHYQRKRPFTVNLQPTCVSADEEGHLENDGSYPSGHTALGWTWALILAQLAPDRADAILARGRAFGQSRVVCNVHWQSDVLEGRMVGAAALSQIQTSPVFQADFAAAQEELAAVRARQLPPVRDCAEEARALAVQAPDPVWPMY